MQLEFAEQALSSFNECLEFLISTNIPNLKLFEIRDSILKTTQLLIDNPKLGSKEKQLSHLKLNHRSLIQSHYKIIYRVINTTIYITDIFDTRQEPNKMKG